MSMMQEIRSVTAINLRSLPQRASTSLVVVIGIAGVVAVLLSVLAIATGLSKTLASTGRVERAIILYKGSQSEVESNIARDAIATVSESPGIKRDTDNKSMVSADSVTSIRVAKKDGSAGSVTFRGVSTKSFAVRPEIKLIQGHMFQPGLREVVVGKSALARFRGLEVGSTVVSGDAHWQIVGVFESNGDAHESELITDADTALTALHRTTFNSVTVWLTSPESFATLKDSITTNPTVTLDVRHESDYYEQQSKRFGSFLAVVANIVGTIMAIGAVFGALNTMYSAVSSRSIEIATLRALGFGSTGVVISVFAESLLLALVGALLGSGAAWIAFNGNSISTITGGSSGLAQVAFSLRISIDLVLLGIVWACAVGLIGGLMPAIRAARLPVAAALRQT
jgi:putative ABC transport system permease protein